MSSCILYLIPLFFMASCSSRQFSQAELRQESFQQEVVDVKCDKSNNKLNPLNKENHRSVPAVELIMEQDTIQMPVKHIQFTIINRTDLEIKADNYYSIERFIDNDWEKCQRKYNTVIDDIGIEIKPQGTYSFTLNMSNIKDGYYKGMYRVCKNIKIGHDIKQIYCIFHVK